MTLQPRFPSLKPTDFSGAQYFSWYTGILDDAFEPPDIAYLCLGANPRLTPTNFLTFATLVNDHPSRRNRDNIENMVEYLSLDHTALDDPKLPGLLPKFSNIKGISIEYPPSSTALRQWESFPSEFRNAWAETIKKINRIGITGILAYPGDLFNDLICVICPFNVIMFEKFRGLAQLSAHFKSHCDVGNLMDLSLAFLDGGEEAHRETESLIAMNVKTLRNFHCTLHPDVSKKINLSGVADLLRLGFTFTPLRSFVGEWLPLAIAILGTVNFHRLRLVVFQFDIEKIQDPTTQKGDRNWDELDEILCTRKIPLVRVIVIYDDANNHQGIQDMIQEFLPRTHQRLGKELHVVVQQ